MHARTTSVNYFSNVDYSVPSACNIRRGEIKQTTYLFIVLEMSQVLLEKPNERLILCLTFDEFRVLRIATGSCNRKPKLGRGTAFPVRLRVRPAKTQISLNIRIV